jgi:hypothetical protein
MSPSVPITDPGPDHVTGIDPWPTLANAYANSAITSHGDCAILNASLLAIYMNSWNMWAAQVVGGYPHDATPPQPPPAWVTFVDDPSGDPTQGYTRIKIGSAPICALPPTPVGPPVPPTAPPNNVDIGNNIPVSGQPSHFWQVGPMDTWPVGKYTPPNAKSADGTVGSFLRLGAVVGSGWYEL